MALESLIGSDSDVERISGVRFLSIVFDFMLVEQHVRGHLAQRSANGTRLKSAVIGQDITTISNAGVKNTGGSIRIYLVAG